jgi:hypothetical protein
VLCEDRYHASITRVEDDLGECSRIRVGRDVRRLKSVLDSGRCVRSLEHALGAERIELLVIHIRATDRCQEIESSKTPNYNQVQIATGNAMSNIDLRSVSLNCAQGSIRFSSRIELSSPIQPPLAAHFGLCPP